MRAVAAPRPDAPPVTMNTLFSICMAFPQSSLRWPI
jgi:hypothetical protein